MMVTLWFNKDAPPENWLRFMAETDDVELAKRALLSYVKLAAPEHAAWAPTSWTIDEDRASVYRFSSERVCIFSSFAIVHENELKERGVL